MSQPEQPSDNQQADSAASPSSQGQSAQIDIHLLAEKVYRLMLADVRLEQARSSAPSHTRR